MALEVSGILNWALRGCIEWQRVGLQPPESVLSAIGAYRADMDVVGSWLEENCELGKGHQELISALFNNYRSWAEDGQEYSVNKARFVRLMEERGFKKCQTTMTIGHSKQKGRFLVGVRITQNTPSRFEKK